MLIDNVGLHRIFGLPVRDRDWEAMFEGRMMGNALSRVRTENRLSVSCPSSENDKRDEELEIVMTHGQLLEVIRNRNSFYLEEEQAEQRAHSVLKAFHDRRSGLWGLKRGNRMTMMPQ